MQSQLLLPSDLIVQTALQAMGLSFVLSKLSIMRHQLCCQLQAYQRFGNFTPQAPSAAG